MQGEVSRIGGTEAGVLPKYKNDITNDQLNNWLNDWVSIEIDNKWV